METATEKRQNLYEFANELLDKSNAYREWYTNKDQQGEVEDSIKEVLRALESDDIIINPIIDELSQNLVDIVVPIIEELELKEFSKTVRRTSQVHSPKGSPRFNSKKDLLDELRQLEMELGERVKSPEKTMDEIEDNIKMVNRDLAGIEKGTLHLKDDISEGDLVDSYVDTEKEDANPNRPRIPVLRYDESDWINFIFEMKERVKNFILHLPTNDRVAFTRSIDTVTLEKGTTLEETILYSGIFGISLAIVGLKVMYRLTAYILKAQSSNNNFFVATEEFLQYVEDLGRFAEFTIRKLIKYQKGIMESKEKVDSRNMWVMILTTIDETEEKLEHFHLYYFTFFRDILQRMLEKVDSEIFWIQKGVVGDNSKVVAKIMDIWKRKIKPFLDADSNLNNPSTVSLPLQMKEIWREIMQFEKTFSLFQKKRFK